MGMGFDAGSIRAAIDIQLSKLKADIAQAKSLLASVPSEAAAASRKMSADANNAAAIIRANIQAQSIAQKRLAQEQKQAQQAATAAAKAEAAAYKERIAGLNTIIKLQKQEQEVRNRSFWAAGTNQGFSKAIQDTSKLKAELMFMTANAAQASSTFYKLGNAIQAYATYANRGIINRIATNIAARSSSASAARVQDLLSGHGAPRIGEIGKSEAAVIENLTSKYSSMIKVAGGAAIGVTAFAGAVFLAAKAVAPFIQSAMALEDSFAGVRKTVDGTALQLEMLSEELRDMSMRIPVSVHELNRIAESAGQLGVKTADIEKFTDTMARIGVTTNLSSDEAATGFAQWKNITRTPMEEVDRLASTIVELGNKTASTEKDILDFGLRLAGAGKSIGLTDANIAGISATLASLGVEAEAGGTAFSTLFYDLSDAVMKGGEKLNILASVTGLTNEKFKQMFENDPNEVILRLLEGLNKFKESGGNFVAITDALGLSEKRMRDALSRTVSGYKDMRVNTQLAAEEYRTNNSLLKESEIRFQTATNKINIMKGALLDIKNTIGNQMLPAFTSFVDVLGKITIEIDKLLKYSPKLANMLVSLPLKASPFTTFGGVVDVFNIYDKVSGNKDARAFEESQKQAYESLSKISELWSMVPENIKEKMGDALSFLADASDKIAGKTINNIEQINNELAAAALMESSKKFDDALFREEDYANKLAEESARELKKQAEETADALKKLSDAGKSLFESLYPQLKIIDDVQYGLEAMGEYMNSISGDTLARFGQSIVDQYSQTPEAIASAMQSLTDIASTLDANTDTYDMYIAVIQSMNTAYEDLAHSIAFADDKLAADTMAKIEIEKKKKEKSYWKTLTNEIGQAGYAITGLGKKFTGFGQAVQVAGEIAATAMQLLEESINPVTAAIRIATIAISLFGSKGEEELHGMAKVIDEIKQASEEWIDELTDKFLEFVKTGKFALDEFLQYVTDEIAKIATKELVIRPIVEGIGNMIGMAKGGAFEGGNIVPFARGGVVHQPMLFPMAKGAGLMGEAGPEAIMPLKRMGNGRLGVETAGSGVIVNINDYRSSGADVEVQERMTPNGRQIEVFIRDQVNKVISNGGIDRTIGLRYGMAARGY